MVFKITMAMHQQPTFFFTAFKSIAILLIMVLGLLSRRAASFSTHPSLALTTRTRTSVLPTSATNPPWSTTTTTSATTTTGTGRRRLSPPSPRGFLGSFICCRFATSSTSRSSSSSSVTGPMYSSEDPTAPMVRLFTKEGCTLCDKVKDVLLEVQSIQPHSLEQVDITDPEHEMWYDKYKYDIPVLHVNNQYWIKHRINKEEATNGLSEARQGTLEQRPGEPDAGALERRQAQRQENQE